MTVRKSDNRDKLIAQLCRATAEVITFDELGAEVLPLAQRLLGGSSAQLYRSESGRPMLSVSGDTLAEMTPSYVADHLPEDPLQPAVHRLNPWIFPFSRCPEWSTYIKHPAARFWASGGIKYFLHVRLIDGSHYEPGMAALVFARSPNADDFSDDDVLATAQLLPALQAATRRCNRTLLTARLNRSLEGLLEDGSLHPRMALDLDGQLLWVSSRARRWLGEPGQLPVSLTQAVNRVSALAYEGVPTEIPSLTVDVVAVDGTRLQAHLRLCRPKSGQPFVTVELEQPGVAPIVAAVADQYRLTATETRVLSLIASGLRDRDIAERTFTSIATVRTHVARILGKLGVHSRLEAALVYWRHCQPPPAEPNS